MSGSLNIMSDSIKYRKMGTHCSVAGGPLLKYQIKHCGYAEIEPPYQLERVGKSEPPHITVWLIEQGRGIYETEFGKFNVGPGDIIIHNSTFTYRCRVEGPVFIHYHFYLEIAPDFPPAVFPATYGRELKEVFGMLYREKDHAERFANLAALLSSYLRSEFKTTSDSRRLQKMYTLLESDMAKPWSTATLAAAMHRSPALLYTLCRQDRGHSPGEIIVEVKFRYAANLLRHTDETLEAIAAAIGYSNAFSFSKACRRVLGKSPSVIRKEG